MQFNWKKPPCITSHDSTFSTKAHELTGERLKLREVVPIDIANDPVKSSDYKPAEDPSKFKSTKTGRGPLVGPDWQSRVSIYFFSDD